MNRRLATSVAVTGVGLLAAHALPAVAFWPQLRAKTMPGLTGLGDPGHVALTFDDGPHPRSTPFFLRELERHGVHATFFVLGSELARAPQLGREIAAAGHEVALHGWAHRRMVWYGPRRTYDEMARGRDLIAAVTGTPPRWFRPPYGVLTSSALFAARRLDLTPILWSCWGWDWSAKSTPASVYDTVLEDLDGGGTILLHDSDVAASVGAWRSTLGALPRLLDECARRGLTVGPLAEHNVKGAKRNPARLSSPAASATKLVAATG
ncbi:MAG TPA: polysaccharide deacetylase family protein [Pseudonocardiaceae bacterium]|jgi:peptidoglycan/xylan/chitin deacetylase (PgdA/CDA1 family)|nr:polysaccharide deacetylase family protein [Pseudonocardiaceae bacterium]